MLHSLHTEDLAYGIITNHLAHSQLFYSRYFHNASISENSDTNIDLQEADKGDIWAA